MVALVVLHYNNRPDTALFRARCSIHIGKVHISSSWFSIHSKPHFRCIGRRNITTAIGRFANMPPHPGDFTAAKRSSTFLQIEGAGNSLTGLLLPPPAKGTVSADWRPYQSHRSGPLGLQNPSRLLRKYLTPTFIALQSWHCFADLRIFSRSLFRGLGV